ncbi:hypothetical protein [Thermoflavimicrobium dichotomicum]|uniref:Uncharacterized protein n=1 Tax=Thermoflavimicrobium dichotomicum TaxID=46223 RepID=A0A1I3T9C0_9BACL|nr:hypothetical protein [Thermoflavimicrobium dichotomicum]SFJ66087.1 hypothetical protein SAMN05421852_1169 [Thermoflavimicrobium dichotomicum]
MKEEARKQLETFLRRVEEGKNQSQGYIARNWSLILCTWGKDWTSDTTNLIVSSLYHIVSQAIDLMEQESVPIAERKKFLNQIRQLADDMEELVDDWEEELS